jgi:hypothetical protein
MMDVRLSRKMRLIDITMIGIGAMGDERRRCLCLSRWRSQITSEAKATDWWS